MPRAAAALRAAGALAGLAAVTALALLQASRPQGPGSVHVPYKLNPPLRVRGRRAARVKATLRAIQYGEATSVEPVLEAMREHRGSACVQARGCAVLRSLAEANAAAIVGRGGVEVILAAVEHAEAAFEGCLALASLLTGATRASRRAALGAVEAVVAAVVAAMQLHSASAAVQEQGCEALGGLAKVEEAQVLPLKFRS